MSKGEVLACSKFYVEVDGLGDLIVQKISGIAIELQTAGDQNNFDVTGVKNSNLTVEYVGNVNDNRLFKWYEEYCSQLTTGSGSINKGVLKAGSIMLYNPSGEEAARWNITGMIPKTYKTNKIEANSTELFIEIVEIAFHSIRRIK
jgi:phage tail-like protein